MSALALLSFGGIVAATAAAPTAASSDPALTFSFLGRYSTGLDDENAEIVAYGDGRMYVTNSSENALDIVDLTDPTDPQLDERIDLALYGGGPNSVDVFDGLVAVAVEADPKTDPGSIVFFDAEGTFLRTVTVGALPDMVTFTPDGRRLLVANEGEPNDEYSIDPVGSISIVDTTSFDVDTVGFGRFDANRAALLARGVRLFGPGASVSQDLEPEYIAVAPDGGTAWVTLQENNAIAEVNLRAASPIVTRILPLGLKDHSVPGNGIDGTDSPRAFSIANWPVWGMYQPDAIAAFQVGGRTFYLTANEGDARDYDGFAEESTVGALSLTPALQPLADVTKLGNLSVSTVGADSDDDGLTDRLFAFGARSFSIWESSGRQVFDSGEQLERVTFDRFPRFFNSNNTRDRLDDRSDNKGPEPEAAATAVLDGRTYAFVGLERIGGVVVYDVTDPRAPVFVDYVTTRVFDGGDPGPDLGPESVEIVAAADSPTGAPLMLVSNEISATVVIHEIKL